MQKTHRYIHRFERSQKRREKRKENEKTFPMFEKFRFALEGDSRRVSYFSVKCLTFNQAELFT